MEIEFREIPLQGDLVGKKILGKIDLPSNVSIAPIHLRSPRASSLAIAGKLRLDDGKIDSVMSLEPMYLRRSEAEELFDRRYHGD